MNDSKKLSSKPAYHNSSFLDSEDGRPMRILAEYLEPLSRLKKAGIRDTIVFLDQLV
jgi:hypothetical protein